ncbi:MAG TPA: DUF5615 family PIN-like protein [Planctomycetota bacterium]
MTVRLLFDENLAGRLVRELADVYPGSTHVEVVLGRAVADEAIWDHARREGLLIVTKDEDFLRLSLLRGAPPKVVWIQRGSSSTSDVAALLRGGREWIERFARHPEATFLVLA